MSALCLGCFATFLPTSALVPAQGTLHTATTHHRTTECTPPFLLLH